MKNDKHTVNKQKLDDSRIFAMRKNKVKWPTLRGAYITDDTSAKLKAYVMSKGRSIIYLEGEYETKLNRYKGDDPVERAVFFEYMLREKGVKGAIQTICWLGNFNNGSIIHFGPQFPQMQCWMEELGQQEALDFFERCCFRIYRDVASILYDNIVVDEEVEEFIIHGQEVLDLYEKMSILQ